MSYAKPLTMLMLIDNGHGDNTPGKCSPDGRLREWKWNRETAQLLSRELTRMGIDCQLLTPEEWDVPLRERVRRANAWCAKLGSANVAVVSVHVNAAGSDRKWHNARGFSVFVAPNASERSKRLARLMTLEFEAAKLMGNRCVPADKYWVGNFAIVRDTKCPAVLTENFFMDNEQDAAWLMTDEGKRTCASLTAEAIAKYIRG